MGNTKKLQQLRVVFQIEMFAMFWFRNRYRTVGIDKIEGSEPFGQGGRIKVNSCDFI